MRNLVLALFFSSLGLAQDNKGVIGFLVDKGHRSWECGCHIGLAGSEGGVTPYYFTEEEGFASQEMGLLNLRGKDVDVTCKRRGDLTGKLHSKYKVTCEPKGIVVTMNLEVTSVCKKHDDGCEVTTRLGTLEASYDGRIEKHSVVGECGC